MTESTMYWITRLDGLHSFFNGIQVLSTIALFVAIVVFAITYNVMMINKDYGQDSSDYVIAKSINSIALKVLIPALCMLLSCSLVQVFVPTTKEMIAIKVIPTVATSEQSAKIKDISNDALDMASAWLKDQTEKIKNP